MAGAATGGGTGAVVGGIELSCDGWEATGVGGAHVIGAGGDTSEMHN